MNTAPRCQYRYGYHPAPVQCERDAAWIMIDDTGMQTPFCQAHRDCNEHEGAWCPVASATSASTETAPDTPESDAAIVRPVVGGFHFVPLHVSRKLELERNDVIAKHTHRMLDDSGTINQLRADLAAAQHQNDSLAASNATFQRLCREAQDAAAEACRQRDDAVALLHPWYGPCDGLAADGACSECLRLKDGKESGDGMVLRLRKERDDMIAIRDCIYGLELEDVVFFNEKWLFNVNDCFFWACADAEPFTAADIPEIERANAELEAVGEYSHTSLLFTCRKRKTRPQGALYPYIKREAWPLFNACGDPRPSDFGNPVGTDQIEDYVKKKASEKKPVSLEAVTAALRQFRDALKDTMGHIFGEHPHWRAGFVAVAAADAVLGEAKEEA